MKKIFTKKSCVVLGVFLLIAAGHMRAMEEKEEKQKEPKKLTPPKIESRLDRRLYRFDITKPKL